MGRGLPLSRKGGGRQKQTYMAVRKRMRGAREISCTVVKGKRGH